MRQEIGSMFCYCLVLREFISVVHLDRTVNHDDAFREDMLLSLWRLGVRALHWGQI